MRKTAILIMIFICWGAMAQMLPGDGATVTVYGIDAEIAECTDGLCDLSAAAVTGETEMRFEYYGDSLVRRTSPQASTSSTSQPPPPPKQSNSQ